MSRKRYEKSNERAAIEALFRAMSYKQELTFAQASTLLGFEIGPGSKGYAAFQNAKKAVEKEGIFIGSIHGVGFYRGNGEDMVSSAESVSHSIRNKARQGKRRTENAFRENLPDKLHQKNAALHNVFCLVEATTTPTRALSNRTQQTEAPTAPKFDFTEALRKLNGGKANGQQPTV